MIFNKNIITISLVSGILFTSTTQANTLKEIGELGLKNDLKIEQLHNNFLSSIEKNNEVAGMFKPQVSLDGSASYTLMEDNALRNYNDSTNGSLGVNFSYSLYDGSEEALKGIQSKEAMLDFYNFEAYKQQSLYSVSQLYYTTLSNRKILEADKENYKAVEKHYKKVKHMLEVGLKTMVDLAEVQAELDQAEANIVSSENNLQNSLYQLYLYTGSYDLVPEDVSFEDKKKDLEDQGYDYWFNILQKNNFNLKTANLSKEISKENIEVQSSNDDFKVRLTGGLNSSYNNRANEDFDNTANIGVSISLPLFDGGVTNSQVKQSQIGYTNAAVNLDYTYRQLEPQLKILINELESMDRGIKSLEKAVSSTKQSFESIQDSYEVGVRDIVDVLNANTQYYISLKNLANSEYNYLIKQNELLYLVGILDLENI